MAEINNFQDNITISPINQEELKILKLLPPLYKEDFYYEVVNYSDPTALNKIRKDENTLINVLEKKTKISYTRLEAILFNLKEEGLVGFLPDNEHEKGFVRRWHLKLY